MGTRLTDTLLKVTTVLHRLTVTIAILALLALVGAAVWYWHKWSTTSSLPASSVSLYVSDRIDPTPTIVEQMKEIGQWEFLAISDEELIDTVRTGIFSDDELARIYYGTLRLGIDFSQCDAGWIVKEGDSIRIDLPPVQLLDENFLDETRTKSFFEKGKWSNADRKAMADRARLAMRRRCLTRQNFSLAQRNAEQEVKKFFERLH